MSAALLAAPSDWLGPVAPALRPAAEALQPAIHYLVNLPDFIGWALIAFGVLLVGLGKHGQRPLMGVLCAGAFCWAAIKLGLGGLQPSGVPTVIPLFSAAAGGALGALLPGWTRGLAVGGIGAAAGQWLALRLGLPALAGALPLAVLCFMVAFVNEAAFAIILPPIGAAVAMLSGVLVSLPLQLRGEHRFLTDPATLIVAALILSAALLPVAIEREARNVRRQKQREATGEDLEEKAQRAAQKAVFERHAEQAKAEREQSGRPVR